MSTWRLGTIGFAYDDWTGTFFPSGLAPDRRLEFYASQFSCIELDTTFYALPPLERADRWADSVPADFVFSLKAPQELTHSGTDLYLNRRLWEQYLAFIDRLGANRTLGFLQFPPTFGSRKLAEFTRFLDHCERPLRLAVEFRHPSWWKGEAYALFRSYGIAWVAADLVPADQAGLEPGEGEYVPEDWMDTADWRYLRLSGIHAQHPVDSYEIADPTARLRWWLNRAPPVEKQTFAFCGNSYAGFGVATCDRLGRMLGIPDRVHWQPSLFDDENTLG